MQLIKEMIYQTGTVLPGNILKVDNFLNHQIDPLLMKAIGEELFSLYSKDNVTKVLTVEASGIAIAVRTAECFGVNAIFAKKSKTANLSGDFYSSAVESYTHGCVYNILVSKKYLNENDRVLIVDDFLARGAALEGLIDIIGQAGATVVGAGIAIEKAFQHGGDKLREKGIRIESMAIIDSMTDEKVILR